MMLVTPILATQSGSAAGGVILTLIKAMVVVGLIVTAAWYLVPLLLQHIVRSRSRELFLLSIIVLCLGIAWLTSLGGLSLALGAFIAGLVIAESEYSHQALAEVLPFRDSFNSLFFVSIGVLMICACCSTIPCSCWGYRSPLSLGNSWPAPERSWRRDQLPGPPSWRAWPWRRWGIQLHSCSTGTRGRIAHRKTVPAVPRGISPHDDYYTILDAMVAAFGSPGRSCSARPSLVSRENRGSFVAGARQTDPTQRSCHHRRVWS